MKSTIGMTIALLVLALEGQAASLATFKYHSVPPLTTFNPLR